MAKATNADNTAKTHSIPEEDIMLPAGEQNIEVVEIAATHRDREIPPGMVAYTATEKNGNTFEGFNTLAGVKQMQAYMQSQGGSLEYDEKKNS